VLVGIQLDTKSRYAKSGFPDHAKLQPFFPLTVEQIWCRGKVIIFQFVSEKQADRIYITSQLAMEGSWLREPADHSNLWFNFEDKEKWYYNDSRHFGTFNVYFSDDELVKGKFADHGPDLLLTALIEKGVLEDLENPLQEIVSLESWKAKLKNKRIKTQGIYKFLKDQDRFSSIGNYLRSEILYRSKIHPGRKLDNLSNVDSELLYRISLDTIYEAYTCRGLTIKSYRDPEGTVGTFPLQVYQQDKDPLGNTVIKQKFDPGQKDQTVHWVKEVQV
jgi:formamidopyrimidine-DNA glycosylase